MNENIKKFGVGFFNEQEKMFVKEKNLLLKILVLDFLTSKKECLLKRRIYY